MTATTSITSITSVTTTTTTTTTRSRRHLLTLFGAAALPWLTGCGQSASAVYDGAGAPDFRPSTRTFPVAWVLSSGGPRGFVHLGVLKALAALGCKPDLVVGSSVGALVGGLYAAGLGLPYLEKLALDAGIADVVRPVLSGDQWLSGAGIADLVNQQVNHKPLQQWPLPFAAVAIAQDSRQPHAFNWGDAGVAVQAACAIEGRLASVRIRGTQYVDADLEMPLPVRMARALGAQKVLAVDASAYEDQAPKAMESFRASDLRKRVLTQADAVLANLTLHPDMGYYAGMSRVYRERALQAGYDQTMTQAAALRALHGLS